MIGSFLEFTTSFTGDYFYYFLQALVNLVMPLTKGENVWNVPFMFYPTYMKIKMHRTI
jgi:hypothetical protein